MGNHTEVIEFFVSANEATDTLDDVYCRISNAKKDLGLPMTVLPTDIVIMMKIVE